MPSKSKPRRTGRTTLDLDSVELQSLVCNLICEGKSVAEVRQALASGRPPLYLKRNQPYELLHAAAKNHRLRWVPKIDSFLLQRLREQYDWLEADVVHTAAPHHVADQAAQRLLTLILSKGGAPAFHIGFAGGGLLEQTARLLADKLRQTLSPLPKTIVFHAMVARMDEDPGTDPNSFVGHFNSGLSLPVTTRFVGLMAPGIVSTETALQLREMDGIRQAYERVAEIDVIVTSAGGHWATGCSRLSEMYKGAGDSAVMARLEAEHCVGDLMWRPIGRKGPIELRSGSRAMTLIELKELSGIIARGKRVLLVMSRCATCGNPKDDVLRTILNLKQRLITDLVVDTLTARAVLSSA